MRVTDLHLDDFGCFQNARIEGLAEELVVIGGPQRAGKTTFTTAMRQLRSGITAREGLPPASNQYRIGAEVVHGGRPYRYQLSGEAAPSITALDGEETLTPDDVFGPVSERQYRQLYTIGLDELRALPPGIDDTDDLAQVLLGAAYGDIAELPAVVETFRDRAYEIGRTYGKPTPNSELRSSADRIEAGMDARQEAGDQVDDHSSVSSDLEDTRATLDERRAALADLRARRDRLNVLSDLHGSVTELAEVRARLATADVDVAERFPTHQVGRVETLREAHHDAADAAESAGEAFERRVDRPDPEPYREWLLEAAAGLERAAGRIELWRDRASDLRDDRDALRDERREIDAEIEALHPTFDGSFERIEAIDTSTYSAGAVRERAEAVERRRAALAAKRTELDAERDQLAALREELATLEGAAGEQEVRYPKRRPAVVALAGLAVGTAVGFATTPLVGGAVGLAVLGAGFALLDTTLAVEPAVDERQSVHGQIQSVESDVGALEGEIERLEEALEAAERELDAAVSELGLPTDDAPGAAVAFYEDVVALSGRIEDHRAARATFEERREAFVEDMRDLEERIAEGRETGFDAATPLETAGRLLDSFEECLADLEAARALDRAEAARREVVEELESIVADATGVAALPTTPDRAAVDAVVEEFLAAADEAAAVREAADRRATLVEQIESRFENRSTRERFDTSLDHGDDRRDGDEGPGDGAPGDEGHNDGGHSDEGPGDDAASWVAVVEERLDEYPDRAAIEAEIERAEAEIESLEAEIDGLRDEIAELEQRQSALASEDDLREAEAQIEAARVEFERLGEEYAVNRIAQALLEDVHERFMGEVVGSLSAEAGEIFARLTREYDGIAFEGPTDELAFRATRPDAPDHGVGELSRATAEQLFLAVRLARIRRTDVSLPVVIDDATTNFDPNHAVRLFELVGELTDTNQVFFLTCHPAFVRRVAGDGLAPDCRSLTDGRFERVADADALATWLEETAPAPPG